MPMLNHATTDTFRASFDSFPDKKTECECLMIWAKTVGVGNFFGRNIKAILERQKIKSVPLRGENEKFLLSTNALLGAAKNEIVQNF